MATTWRQIKQKKRGKAPEMTSFSKIQINRAVWELNSLAMDYATKRVSKGEFQGAIDMAARLNMPVACNKVGTDKNTKMPIYQCFSYPADTWEKAKVRPLSKRHGGYG